MKQKELSNSDRVFCSLFGNFDLEESITITEEDIIKGYRKFRETINEAKENGSEFPFNAK